VKLNLGSGPRVVPGWVAIDRSPSIALHRVPLLRAALRRAGVLAEGQLAPWPKEVVRRDLRAPLPYPAASADAIYSSHTLEHLYLDEARRVLAECHRVLRPGGVLRLALPDARAFAAALLADPGSPAGGDGRVFNQRLQAHPESRPGMLAALVRAAGSAVHRWQPTEDLVGELLADAGFTAVERRRFREGALPELAVIEHRPESLFVEAFR
jgi:predicted SAM-dependent methyltransferase